MNLEVSSTKKILLVEESQGLTLNTDSKQTAVAIGGVSVKGPQGERGDVGLTGPTGVVSIDIIQGGNVLVTNPAIIYYLPVDRKIVFNASTPGNNDNYIVLGNDSRLTDARDPKPNSVTNSAVANGSISPNKVTGTAVIDSDVRLSNNRTPIDGSVTDVKIVSGGLSPSKITGTAIIEGDSRLTNTRVPTPGTVVDQSITSGGLSPSKITGTAVIESDSRLTDNRIPVNNSVTLSKIDSTTVKLNTIAAPSADVNFGGYGLITSFVSGLATPPADNDHAASKLYVDQKAVGLQVKDAAKLATTANIDLSGAETIDGVAVTGNGSSGSDRILVKNQNAPEENGIYYANTSGSWTRTPDMSSSWSQVKGAYVFVTSGNTQGNTAWVSNVTALTGTIGDPGSPIGFSLFSSVNISAGPGITILGQQISAKYDDSSIKVNGDNKLYVNLVPIANGGTGATTASQARTNLELGDAATKNVGVSGGVADYTATQTALSGKSNVGHTHNGSDINTGTITTDRLSSSSIASSSDTSSAKIVVASDSRLSDARTPVAHNHDASHINSGTLNIARVPAGTSGSQVAFGNHTHTFKTTQSFAIQGNIVTNTDLPMPSFFAMANGTTIIERIICRVGSGGSVTFKLRRNAIGSFPNTPSFDDLIVLGTSGTMTAQTTGNSYTPSSTITIANMDEIALNIDGISGSPKNLSVTIVFQHTITGP